MTRKSLMTVLLSVSLCFSGWHGLSAQDDAMALAKALFLQRQFWQVIEECRRVIETHPEDKNVLAEANYFTATSYVNLFDFLTAKKNFQAIVKNYKDSDYYEDAYIGLGDIEFLQENYQEAVRLYTEFLLTTPGKKRLATLYFRLAEVSLKLNNRDDFEKYLFKLRKEFPDSFEARDANRLFSHCEENFYTVQVGSFTDYALADQAVEDLKKRGYEVRSVLCMLSGKKLCRIRIGRFATVVEAEAMKERLELEGYPGKIFPHE